MLSLHYFEIVSYCEYEHVWLNTRSLMYIIFMHVSFFLLLIHFLLLCCGSVLQIMTHVISGVALNNQNLW